MGPDLSKMSDDELFNRLGQLQSRLEYAGASAYGANLQKQLLAMMDEVNFVITDRIERMNMEQKLKERPEVIVIDGPQEKKKTDDSNSRAKSKSDIISRLKRSSVPTNLKDA
jgi:regulator of replication initiation timing